MDENKKAMIRELYQAIVDIECKYHHKVVTRNTQLGYSIDQLKSCLMHDVFADFLGKNPSIDGPATLTREDFERFNNASALCNDPLVAEDTTNREETKELPKKIKTQEELEACQSEPTGKVKYRRVSDKELAKYAGKMTDKAAAEILGCSHGKVWHYRTENNIPFYRKRRDKSDTTRKPPGPAWSDKRLSIIGTMSDKEAGARLNLHENTIYKKRTEMGIKSYRESAGIVQDNIELLDSFSDEELAYMLDVPAAVVLRHRQQKTIDDKMGS